MLPGMPHDEDIAVPPNPRFERKVRRVDSGRYQHYEDYGDALKREVGRTAGKHYRGPLPGQMAMGPHGEPSEWKQESAEIPGARATRSLEADSLGFYQEHGEGSTSPVGRTTPSTPWDPRIDAEQMYGENQSATWHRGVGMARGLGSHYYVGNPKWNTIRQTQVHVDTPVHTTQPSTETFDEDPNRIHGMIDSGQIHKPAHLLRLGGRLFALDGHHRIATARIRGDEHYPAKIWDADAEGLDTHQAHERFQAAGPPPPPPRWS